MVWSREVGRRSLVQGWSLLGAGGCRISWSAEGDRVTRSCWPVAGRRGVDFSFPTRRGLPLLRIQSFRHVTGEKKAAVVQHLGPAEGRVTPGGRPSGRPAGGGQGYPEMVGRPATARVAPLFHGHPSGPSPSSHHTEALATRWAAPGAPGGPATPRAKRQRAGGKAPAATAAAARWHFSSEHSRGVCGAPTGPLAGLVV